MAGAKQPELHLVALFLQVEGAVEEQPEFQWAAEQGAWQLQIAYYGQTLPALLLKRRPVARRRRRELLERGKVSAVVGKGLV